MFFLLGCLCGAVKTTLPLYTHFVTRYAAAAANLDTASASAAAILCKGDYNSGNAAVIAAPCVITLKLYITPSVSVSCNVNYCALFCLYTIFPWRCGLVINI